MTGSQGLLVFAVCAAVLATACAREEDRAEADISQARASSGTVEVDGVEFDYNIEGTGKLLLLVGDALSPARASSDALREHFMFVVMESRGTIPSSEQGPIEAITMENLVDDVEAVRSALDLDDVCVLGHSIYGILALEYARKYPEHVSCVIMHGTPPFWNERALQAMNDMWEAEATAERKRVLEQNWARVTQDSLSKLDRSETGKLTYILNAPRYWYDPTYDCSWILEGAYWNMAAVYHLLDVIMSDYDLAAGSPVQTPVFLAIGRYDFVVPYYLWDGEKEKLPSLSYHLFEKSGHYPMLEEQARFDSLLVQWVEGL